MATNQNRDAQIIKMNKNGASYGKISKIFNISRERVRQIVKKPEIASKHNERRIGLLYTIKHADDINKKWPLEELISAMQFSTKATNTLVI